MEYTLGIDMGSTSLGWSIVETQDEVPIRVKKIGVRIFPDGRTDKDKTPLAVKRREARSSRRNRDRYIQRRNVFMNKLVKYGLMPSDENERKELQKLNPYELRTRALDEQLTPYELGRALFHINQRRGFKSSRKTERKEKTDSSMLLAIESLKEKIAYTGSRTLGEYLYNLNKGKDKTQDYLSLRVKSYVDEKNKTVYDVFPSRAMYEQEVNLILEKQNIDKDIATDLKETIFNQRDLKIQEKGYCTFEPNEHRCYIAYDCFQKFRALQQINILKLRYDGEEKELTLSQKKMLSKYLLEDFSKLNDKHLLTFSQIKKILKTDESLKKINFTFNLEKMRKEGLLSNTTAVLFKEFFPNNYNEVIDEIVDLFLEEDDKDKLKQKLSSYNLTSEQIDRMAELNVEEGVGNLSAKAINKIIPHLEKGLMYDKAVVAAGYTFSLQTKGVLPENYTTFINPVTKETYDELPYYGQVLKDKVIGGTFDPKDLDESVEKYYGKINNPTVHIALNQLRKLINTIVKEYGHPNKIVVELARELKFSKEKCHEIDKQQTENEKNNDRIGSILKSLGINNNYDNRMKIKIWEDLAPNPEDRCCPYCGKKIPDAKTAMSSDFEIDYILPFSKTYLDSRNNKVLACRCCNRQKDNKTPYEAFHNDEKHWNEIMERIKNYPFKKQQNFRVEALKDSMANDFIARMLTDTQYMSRIAREYLCFVTHPTKVICVPGVLTSQLRFFWGLNNVVGTDNVKDRTDHRHHAIDAFIVACTSSGTIQKYSVDSRRQTGKLPSELAPNLPYPTYRQEEIQNLYDNLVISHKMDNGGIENAIKKHSTSGQLHDLSYYGYAGESERKGYVKLTTHIPVEDIKTLDDLEVIVDQQGTANPIRNLIHQNFDTVENTIQNYFKERGSRKVKVYVEKSLKTVVLFKNKENKIYKCAFSGSNAFAEIYMPNRGKYANKWVAEIVSTFDAHKPDLELKWRKEEPCAKKIMRIYRNDMIAYEKDGQTIIARVKKLDMSSGRVFLIDNKIAKGDDSEAWGASAEQLRLCNARKVYVDMLGNVKNLKVKK